MVIGDVEDTGEVVCVRARTRDGGVACPECGDRWHLWHGLGEAVRKEVAAYSACWAKGMPLQEGRRAATTRERWQQVHELRARNVGLLDRARWPAGP